MNTARQDPLETLWSGANIATMVPGTPYGALPDGAVLTRDDRIVWVGPSKDVPAPESGIARVTVQCRGLWITPGLIDCHTHLVYGGDRSNEFEMRLNGADYKDIARAGGGILSTVRATRAATEDDLYRSAHLRLDRMREEGVTTVEIKSGYGLDVDSELKMLRVARRLGETAPVDVCTTFLGAHTVPPEFTSRADYVSHVVETMLPAVAREGLADAVDVFCESIAFSLDDTRRIFEAARALGLSLKLHAEQLSDSSGAALAAGFKALSADHLEFVSEDSARKLAEAGTVAVMLPGAYYFLREKQRPPVDMFRKHGVPLALATDCNPGTSPMQSILLAMNMACVLFHMSPEEALAGTTRNAARALGLANEKGVIAPGKTADLAFWDISSPLALSYAMGAKPCVGVVKDGVLAWNDAARGPVQSS
jgi:imidazolonepropionase